MRGRYREQRTVQPPPQPNVVLLKKKILLRGVNIYFFKGFGAKEYSVSADGELGPQLIVLLFDNMLDCGGKQIVTIALHGEDDRFAPLDITATCQLGVKTSAEAFQKKPTPCSGHFCSYANC